MIHPTIKIALKAGLVTAGMIILYALSNQLLIYHYLKYEYYMAGIALVALVAGILLSNKYHSAKQDNVPTANPLDELTSKEVKILGLIGQGLSNKEIAALNFVEISTVKTHINNIYTKLNVSNRKAAIKLYNEHSSNAKSTFSPPAVI